MGEVRIAVEGCGHGTLDAIYASVKASCKARGWDGVDLLIIGGDFQATRNAADLSVMSVPPKYRQLGDFPAYYSGEKKAPYLTIFIGGNHEASSYLRELYYGGWVAPQIYYLGAANVLRFGPLRVAGMSGIWKGFDYRKPHHERLPFNMGDIKSFYHVREIDVRKLLLLREQVDIGMSHDWPRGIVDHGNASALLKAKPLFEQEILDGALGSPAAEYVMDHLRPTYWFSAHLHCKFAALKMYDAPKDEDKPADREAATQQEAVPEASEEAAANPDEIDLDMDDDEGDQPPAGKAITDADSTQQQSTTSGVAVSDELRAQLPASFAKPTAAQPKLNPGQPVPPTITNTTTRFLALDKCLPGRAFMQLVSVQPINPTTSGQSQSQSRSSSPKSKSKSNSDSNSDPEPRNRLEYDPEWLAITRVFAQQHHQHHNSHTQPPNDPDTPPPPPPDLGSATYWQLIDEQRAWVDEHVTRAGKLVVPDDFAPTAPPHRPDVDPVAVAHQPDEYTNPHTAAFCALLDVPNLWDASPEERAERKARGPVELGTGDGVHGRGYGGGGGGGGFGRGRGRGGGFNRWQGRGRGRGGGGRGRGGRGRGRGS
ncbi:lariat debranching enzyme, C-terminal domain-containing protein [Hypoxylon sp. NC1633]|nr:lariat debranching enzyme, C-terminal domain-containing protein [Hypoxylon sp. NC1633]